MRGCRVRDGGCIRRGDVLELGATVDKVARGNVEGITSLFAGSVSRPAAGNDLAAAVGVVGSVFSEEEEG